MAQIADTLHVAVCVWFLSHSTRKTACEANWDFEIGHKCKCKCKGSFYAWPDDEPVQGVAPIFASTTPAPLSTGETLVANENKVIWTSNQKKTPVSLSAT